MKNEITVNKIVRIIQSYLIYAFPFMVVCMLLNESIVGKVLWEVLSINLITWFAVALLFLILLVGFASVREKTLKRLANLKERDEREEYVTGKASKKTYISTLSLLIFFLFLSIVSVNITRVPEAQAINGKRGTLNIGMKFDLLDKPHVEKTAEGEVLFESKDIPLSKTGIVLILLMWQLASFNLAARRELHQGG